MGKRCLSRLLLSSLIPLSTVGCQLMHPPAPVSILIRDAETKATIPGADVVLSYPAGESGSHGKDSTGKTGDDGVAHLQAATGADAIPQVKIIAANYLPEQKGLPGEALHATRETNFLGFSPSRRAPIEIVYEVYAGPPPAVELVLPVGYRGLVRAEVVVREDVVYPRGERTFRYDLPANGVVQVEGPPILRYGKGPEFHARYLDGTPLPIEPRDDEIALRWLRAEGRVEVFVVGTKGEWVNYRKAGDKPWNSGAKSGDQGGKSGRGGRGGRGGGGGGGA